MTAFVKNIIMKYYQKFMNSERPIKQALFNLILIMGLLGGFISLLISSLVKLPTGQLLVMGMAEFVLIGCFYLANFKDKMQLASICICSIITLVLFPLMYFSGGGTYSGMPFWFAIGMLFTFLLIDGKAFFVLLALEVIVLSGCFLAAYYYPNLVTDIDTKAGVFVDVWQCMLVLTFAIGSIFKFQVKIYSRVLDLNKEQNEQLEIARKEAEESKEKAISANQAKSTFLASMSHEIRTPINAVLGMDEMILRECRDDAICEYARSIQVAGRQLLSLINQILDFSKIESGKMEILNVAYDTSSLIQDSYSMLAESAEKKNLELKVICDEDLPKTMSGDEVRIRQIIVNLLTNAIKYTEEGCVTLKVQGTRRGDKEILLTISVKDTGMGIQDENRIKLFESFQRINEEKNYYVEGTGLGLAVVKQLLDLMGGEIKVYSVYGQGSEFVVKLVQEVVDWTPVGDCSQRYKQVNQENSGYVSDYVAPEAQLLVVDDVPMNLIVAKNLLKSLKVQVDTAGSGMECLEMIREKRYHIIFMDHMMPNMDGIEVLHRMKEMTDSKNHDVPVIMLTANAISGMKGKYLSEGFVDYLSKPIWGKDLERTVRKYLPKELVKSPSSLEEEVQKEGEEEGGMSKLRSMLPEIDTELGISYCGGTEDIYLDVLKEYCENNRIEQLKTFFLAQDWENYRVHVHSLKSTSLTIGLSELSELAKEVELAVKEEDYGHVTEKHPGMLQQYQEVLERMEKCL